LKILFSAWPGYGHLMPMVALVRAAERAGHEAVITTGPDLAPYASRLGVATVAAGPTAAESYSRLPGGITISRLPAAEQNAFAAKHLFGAAAAARARDLAVFSSEWKPDLVVHDPLELAAAAVAVSTETAHVTHGYGPMHAENDDMITVIGSALATAVGVDPTESVFAAPYLDICPPGMRTRDQVAWRDVRPLRPSAGEPGDGSIAGTIAALPHRETVYFTLGTVMNQTGGVFRAVLDAADELDINIVMTTGPNLDPAAIGPLSESAIAYPFLQQADVLPHCSAVVSHAGAGTMLGALCFGLPQLCLPQSTDQPLNAASLVATGAALCLQPHETVTETIVAALHKLLHEPPYRESAARLRIEIEAMPHAQRVIGDLTA
jgi:UDP:flavonoid glycosyltransferase YjiC (YdhE family)